ncbi:hypothetical protein WN51_07045 [Melipona quadrifasciata]|uniref:Uncharacterized protein n=1 Tax=Melipona quadrifasciata TaxID=166423 RepID=A0A0M8ZPJ7_9HYME|nr:hypothetical protein WN51_07045 [Melipona quadrifasciata]
MLEKVPMLQKARRFYDSQDILRQELTVEFTRFAISSDSPVIPIADVSDVRIKVYDITCIKFKRINTTKVSKDKEEREKQFSFIVGKQRRGGHCVKLPMLRNKRRTDGKVENRTRSNRERQNMKINIAPIQYKILPAIEDFFHLLNVTASTLLLLHNSTIFKRDIRSLYVKDL